MSSSRGAGRRKKKNTRAFSNGQSNQLVGPYASENPCLFHFGSSLLLFFRFVFLLRFLDSFVRSFQYPVALPVTLLHCNVSIWDLLGDDPSTEERSRAVYLGIGVCDVTSHLDMCMCDLEHMYEKKKNTLNSEVVAMVS
jgi:hypothetical protein